MKNLILTLLCCVLFGISGINAQVFKCEPGSGDSLSIGPAICIDSTASGMQYLQFIVTTSSNIYSGTMIQNIPEGSFIKCRYDSDFEEIQNGMEYFYGSDTCIVQIKSGECDTVDLDITVYEYRDFPEECVSTFQNVLFSPVDSIEVTDPCNCNDPGNILDMAGNITLFREVLTVNFANFDDEITLASGDPNFQDENGAPISDGTLFTQTAPGVFELEFYRPSSTSYTVTIQREFSDGAVQGFVFSSMEVCESEDCVPPPIPTMGTWALIILGISLSIFALVGMRQRYGMTA